MSSKELEKTMLECYPLIRHKIVEGKSVANVQLEIPYFFNKRVFSEHLLRLTGVIQNTALEALETGAIKIEQYIQSRKKIEVRNLSDGQKMMRLLAHYFNEEETNLFLKTNVSWAIILRSNNHINPLK
jgi:hypothetical protein